MVEFGGFSKPSELTEEETRHLSDTLWVVFNERDWERFFSMATPDFTASTDPLWPGGGEFTGREDNEKFLEQFLEPWESLRYERREDPTTVGDRILERGSWIGTGRTTGLDGRLDFSVVVEVDGGLLSRIEFFIDDAVAQEYARTGERPR